MDERPMITTHVLDTSTGKPAKGIAVILEGPTQGKGVTNADGRAQLGEAVPGRYRLTFEVASYFPDGFYPSVTIDFQIREAKHHHVPLLLSPFGYSTYRGS